MKLWSIGLEWWILYFLISVLLIAVCNHLARILGEVSDAISGLRGDIEDAIEVLHYVSEESSDDN